MNWEPISGDDYIAHTDKGEYRVTQEDRIWKVLRNGEVIASNLMSGMDAMKEASRDYLRQ